MTIGGRPLKVIAKEWTEVPGLLVELGRDWLGCKLVKTGLRILPPTMERNILERELIKHARAMQSKLESQLPENQ